MKITGIILAASSIADELVLRQGKDHFRARILCVAKAWSLYFGITALLFFTFVDVAHGRTYYDFRSSTGTIITTQGDGSVCLPDRWNCKYVVINLGQPSAAIVGIKYYQLNLMNFNIMGSGCTSGALDIAVYNDGAYTSFDHAFHLDGSGTSPLPVSSNINFSVPGDKYAQLIFGCNDGGVPPIATIDGGPGTYQPRDINSITYTGLPNLCIGDTPADCGSQEHPVLQLTNDLAFDGRPAWSPDGNSIAFISNRGKHTSLGDVWAVNPDGTNLRQLTAVPDFDEFGLASIAWIGNTGDIAVLDTEIIWEYFRVQLSAAPSLPIVRTVADGDSPFFQRLLFIPGGLGSNSFAVSPGGGTAAWTILTTPFFSCPWQSDFRISPLAALNGDSATVVGSSLLLAASNCPSNAGESFRGIAFSPNGSEIVVSHNIDSNSPGFDLEIYKTDGTFVRRLTFNGTDRTAPTINYNPSWSSDNRIAFASNRTGQFEIYIINPDGSNQTAVTTNGGDWPSWSPDSFKIAFQSTRNGNSEIYSIPVNSNRPASGTISVNTNNASAIFTITDGVHTFAGSGTAFVQVAPPGTYTITFEAVVGFATPSSATALLDAGGTIEFSGNYVALPPALSISPLATDFDRQIIGMPSPTKNISIQNSGGGILVPIFNISGDFSQSNNCAIGLSAGQTCQATVSFVPSEPGTRNSMLSISNSSPILNQQILLTGVGTLAFPLKGSIPRSDQGLTAATVEINSVFDHSMQNDRGQYSIYDCDKKVIDFINEIGDASPTDDVGTRCEKGYSQTNKNLFQVNGNYAGSGKPKILFYDGHPGYDYQSSFGNQVYAATAGTIYYPTLEELQKAGITVGGDPDDFHVLELDAAQDLKLFYLHLSTHPRTISIYLEKSVTGQDFTGMQDSRFSMSVEPSEEAPKGSLSLSGTVTINGVPTAKIRVELSGIVKVAKRNQSPCVNEIVETDNRGQYDFKDLAEGFYNVRPVEKGFGFEPTAQQALAAEGSHVLAGDLIAQSGNAGPCLEPHLHFEVQRATIIDVTDHLNGRILRFIPVDPYGWQPVTSGTPDPYFEIPDLKAIGLSNETLWQVTNTDPQ
jgi:hypothetical protein